jgi:hypothetical protein
MGVVVADLDPDPEVLQGQLKFEFGAGVKHGVGDELGGDRGHRLLEFRQRPFPHRPFGHQARLFDGSGLRWGMEAGRGPDTTARASVTSVPEVPV